MIKWFKNKEFNCKCGCGKNNISITLVSMLDELREKIGIPIVINSGCRCKTHNKMVGGADDSAHVEGLAVDIRCLASQTRYKLLDKIFKINFARVGIAKTFIHVDIDFTKSQEVVWLYQKEGIK